MAVIQAGSKGRNFTAEELIGRRIRIECPAPRKNRLPTGHTVMIIADDEQVDNAYKVDLVLEAQSVVEAKIRLYRLDLPDAPTEEITLRDDIELSISAIVTEVQ